MLKRILKIVVVIVILFVALFFGYMLMGHYDSVDSIDNYPNASYVGDNIVVDNDSDTLLIVYPGGKVESESYIYLADVDADVIIVQFPFELAMFAYKQAGDIISENDQYENYYILGHSLGGAFASQFVSENPDMLDGIIYLGSYPIKEGAVNIDTLAIFGEDDLVVGDYNEFTHLFNADDEIVVLKDANHSGFGDYGQQKGDSVLTDEQLDAERAEIVRLVNEFIK